MYFIHLVNDLDNERKNWRQNTVIMLDNAPYHKSQLLLKFFELKKISVLYTGPHSYDAAPCELFFAAFKAADINPRHLPTGKK